MTAQDIDRIQSAINHIKTSLDIDPWAMEIAVEAMQEKMEHFADVGKKDDLRESTKKTGDLIDRAEAQIEIMLTAKRYVISAEAQAEGHVLWSAETIDLESALDALRRVPSAQPEKRTDKRTETHACDCISRRAAIDVIKAISNLDEKAKGGIILTLSLLDSAQPEVTEEEVKEYCYKRCLCIVDSAFLKKYASAQTDNRLDRIADIVEGTIDHLDRDDALDMLYQIKDDLISRQAAIDAIQIGLDYSNAQIRALQKLPSAQQEIIRCKDCKWRENQSGSRAWLPCRALIVPDDFYCARAERRNDG